MRDSSGVGAIGCDNSEEAEWKLASDVEGEGRCCAALDGASSEVAGKADEVTKGDASGKVALVADVLSVGCENHG